MRAIGDLLQPTSQLTATQVLGAVNDVFVLHEFVGAVAQQWEQNRIIYSCRSAATRAVIQAQAQELLKEAQELLERRYAKKLPDTKLIGRS